jgi:hypothetical protein
MSFRKIFMLFLVLSLSASAETFRCENLWLDSRLSSDLPNAVPDINLGPGFTMPNEKNPAGLASDLKGTPSGIYVAVGTERALMGAALNKGHTAAVIQLDRDDKVVTYNLFNRALLALAKNREHYLQLRLRGTLSEIQTEALQNRSGLSLENQKVLNNPKMWEWWNEHVQLSLEWQAFHQDPHLNVHQEFIDANYLFDDQLYAHVSRLAKENRIIVLHENLGSETLVQRLQQISQALGLRISIFDMSNAWQEGYLGHQKTVKLFESLRGFLEPEARFVMSYLTKGSSQTGNLQTQFAYTVINLASLNSTAALIPFMQNMEKQEPSRIPPARSRLNRFE